MKKGNTTVALKFWPLLGASVKHFLKKLQIFLGFPALFSIVMIVLGALGATLGIAGVMGAGDGALVVASLGILGVALMFVLGTVYNIALLDVSFQQWESGKPVFWATLKSAFSRVWKGLLVSLRAFWYIAQWPLAIGGIAALLWALLGAFSLGNLDAGALASGEGSEAVFGMLLGAFAGVGMLGMIIGGVAFVIAAYFMIDRSIRAMFALYAFVNDGLGVNASLEKSIKTVEGRWWKVFGYGILGMIIMQVVQWPLVFLAEAFGDAVGSVFMMIVSLSMGSIAVLFLSGLYLALNKK